MPIIKTIKDPFTHDWGKVAAKRVRAVKSVLRPFMKRIGELTESPVVGVLRNNFPLRCTACNSCGFSPKTDLGKGLFQTAYGILHAIYYKKYFICHSGQPEWGKTGNVDSDRLRLCGNMSALQACHETELTALANRTMNAIKQIMQRRVQ